MTTLSYSQSWTGSTINAAPTTPSWQPRQANAGPISLAAFASLQAAKRGHSEAFEDDVVEAGGYRWIKKSRVSPDADVVYTFNETDDEDNGSDALFNEPNIDEEEEDVCSAEELERELAAIKAQEEAEAQAQAQAKLAAEEAQAKARAAAQNKTEAELQTEAAKKKAKRAALKERREKKKKAQELADALAQSKASRAAQDAAKAWEKVMANRSKCAPAIPKAMPVAKISSLPVIIDLSDDNDDSSASGTNSTKSQTMSFSSSSPVIIDLTDDDDDNSSESTTSAAQQVPVLKHDAETTPLLVPPPGAQVASVNAPLDAQYNSNGFPLHQAKMVRRTITKQERAANPKLKSHVKELEFSHTFTENRSLLIANTSISITEQKNVQDPVMALVQSLTNEELKSIRYVDGVMHHLSDFKLLASRCQERSVELAINELRVQPTWLWTHPEFHRTVCKYLKKCDDKICRRRNLHHVPDESTTKPEVRKVDVPCLLAAMKCSTCVREPSINNDVLQFGMRTLSEKLTWTKTLSIDLSFKAEDVMSSRADIEEARKNLQLVNDKHRLVFRKRVETRDCELVVRFATDEELNDPALAYQRTDEEVLEWLQAVSEEVDDTEMTTDVAVDLEAAGIVSETVIEVGDEMEVGLQEAFANPQEPEVISPEEQVRREAALAEYYALANAAEHARKDSEDEDDEDDDDEDEDEDEGLSVERDENGDHAERRENGIWCDGLKELEDDDDDELDDEGDDKGTKSDKNDNDDLADLNEAWASALKQSEDGDDEEDDDDEESSEDVEDDDNQEGDEDTIWAAGMEELEESDNEGDEMVEVEAKIRAEESEEESEEE